MRNAPCVRARRGRAHRLLLLVLLGGCSRERHATTQPAPAPAPTPPPAPAPAPASAAPLTDLCAIASAGPIDASAVAVTPSLPYGRCWKGPRGAWSLAFEPLADGGAEARVWVAIHADAHGVVTRRARSFRPARGETDPDGPSVPDFGWIDEAWAEAYDFDGDGDPELFVGLHGIWSSHTGLELAESVLYTFRDGAIVRYAPATSFGIWKLEDRDRDGRPDLVTSSPYARSRGGSTPVFSPTLVAHSLPDGTFSTTDAIAEQSLRAACPSKPALSSLRRARSLGNQPDDAAIACARLWGISVETIVTALHLPPTDKTDWPAILDVAPPMTLR